MVLERHLAVVGVTHGGSGDVDYVDFGIGACLLVGEAAGDVPLGTEELGGGGRAASDGMKLMKEDSGIVCS